MMKMRWRTAWLPVVALVVLTFARPSRAAEQTRNRFSGTITAIEARGNSVTVKAATASRIFQVASDTAIVTLSKTDAALEDLKVGDRVNVSFTEEHNIFTAHRIECTSSGEIP